MPTPGAPQPLGMTDFFALEAGEYVDRLDGLLQAPATPPADELVRLARALRGSALMASQQPIARAAMGFEALARGLREGRRQWDAATKQLATRALDDIKIFVCNAGKWSDADTAKAEALASQLEQLGGRPSAQVRAAEAMGLDAGARAFVAREGAAIASALDRAGRALRTNPLVHDPLQQVLKAIQPLRGLAALNDLPPLPDLLEGIERAIGELNRTTGNAPPGWGDLVAELFQMAATSIAHAAREVAERGRPDPESAEFRRFAGLVVKFMDSEPDVVPIETLGTIVRRGTAASATRPATLGRVELVSHGEHLRQAADSLERAPSATQRELRAHTLAGTFRVLGAAGGGPVAPPPPPPSTPADRARRSAAVPAPPIGAESATDIAGTWMRYQQLVAGGVGPASLEELISGGRGNGGGNEAVDIRTLLYKGASAQHRAQELRDAAKRASGETLRPIIDEVCDLVVPAIQPEYP